MHREDDIPLSDEELALAKRGEALISAAVSETQAPQSLRESIERERQRAQTARPSSFWWRHARALAGAAVAALAVAVALVAIQTGGGTSEPSLAAVAGVAQLEATAPAPAPGGGDPPVLDARVEPISFPDWEKSFGWMAVGSRQDELEGRVVRTVFYRNAKGSRLGYSIVAGEPLAESPPGDPVQREGHTYHVARRGDHTQVTWTQEGHTCVFVASAAVPDAKLVEIAASRNT